MAQRARGSNPGHAVTHAQHAAHCKSTSESVPYGESDDPGKMTYSRLALIERDLLIMRVKAKSRVKASGSNERSKACHTHDGPHTLRQGARTPDELEKHDLLDQHDRDTTDTIQHATATSDHCAAGE